MNKEMGKEIAFLSSWKGFSELVKQTAREIGVQNVGTIAIYPGGCEKAIRQIEIKECKLVIAKKHVIPYLSPKVNVAMQPMRITSFDLLQNLNLIGKKYKRIAYLGSRKEGGHYDFAWLAKLLNLEIKPFLYDSDAELECQVYKDIESQIQSVFLENVDFVLTTGSCLVELFRKAGVPAGVAAPGKESIIEAINRAKESLATYYREVEYKRHIFSLANAFQEGLITVDQGGKITVFNSLAERLLGVPAIKFLGQNVSELNFLPQHLQEIFVDNHAALEKVLNAGEKKLHIKRETLRVTGTLIKIREARETEMFSRTEANKNREGFTARYTFNDIIGHSEAIRMAISQAKVYAGSESTILIAGESGTGKELFAQSIHNYSQRRYGPFIAVNCSTLPDTLLDSELFGYEGGSFTGASKAGKPGLFELANQGTIFLDEITELTPALQAKLLRVLQEREIRRIGGKSIIPINVRVIVATNRDLIKEINQGKFREDLYYRLNVLRIDLPPLRERKADIPALLAHFLRKRVFLFGISGPEIVPEFLQELIRYEWPGNVRELENFAERYIFYAGEPGMIKKLLSELRDNTVQPEKAKHNLSGAMPHYLKIRVGKMEEMEEQILEQLVFRYNMKKKDLARVLGMSRTTLWRKIKAKQRETSYYSKF